MGRGWACLEPWLVRPEALGPHQSSLVASNLLPSPTPWLPAAVPTALSLLLEGGALPVMGCTLGQATGPGLLPGGPHRHLSWDAALWMYPSCLCDPWGSAELMQCVIEMRLLGLPVSVCPSVSLTFTRGETSCALLWRGQHVALGPLANSSESEPHERSSGPVEPSD